jgi:uncharacterized iron-regulated membrane protein
MRKTLVFLHRYLGLALGLFLIGTGLTGSAIVFSKAIDTFFHPELLTVAPRPDVPLQIDALLRNARKAIPGDTPTFVYMPLAPTEAAQVLFQSSGLRVHADPYTGEVLGTRHPNDSLTGLLIDFHVHLLAGKTGKQIQGWIGLGAILLSLVGFLLWWPKHARWKQAFSIKWGAGAFRVWFDAHRVSGAIGAVLIVLTALTGSALALYDLITEPILIAATGGGTRQPQPKAPSTSGGTASIDAMLTQAKSMFPDGQITRLSLPVKDAGAVGVRMRLNGEIHQFGRSFVWFSRYDGQILRVDNALEANSAVKIQSWLFPLHTGVYGGPFTQWLQLLVGLVLAFLSFSGAWLWIKKARAKTITNSRRVRAGESVAG